MPAATSSMLPLGTPAPDFRLLDANGRLVSRADFDASPALLVTFICNHCPFVVHLSEELARFADEYLPRGLAIVAINANDADAYPADSPAKMRDEVVRTGYRFAYMHNADQSVAKAYRAVCTPDFFLYDRQRLLVYRGQFDDSRPGNGKPVTGKDLRMGADAVLAGAAPPSEQVASMGCSIKWKPGNAPAYAG